MHTVTFISICLYTLVCMHEHPKAYLKHHHLFHHFYTLSFRYQHSSRLSCTHNSMRVQWLGPFLDSRSGAAPRIERIVCPVSAIVQLCLCDKLQGLTLDTTYWPLDSTPQVAISFIELFELFEKAYFMLYGCLYRDLGDISHSFCAFGTILKIRFTFPRY